MPNWKKLIVSGSDAVLNNITASGNISSSGKIITTEVESPTNFLLDVEGDITLDANGADILLKDDGTSFGRLKRDSSNFVIKSEGRDKSIIFKGNDSGSAITALTLDMSDSGSAIFNNHITASGTISASGTVKGAGLEISTAGGITSFIADDSGLNDMYFGIGTSSPSTSHVLTVVGTTSFQGNISASGYISASNTRLSGTLSIPGFPDVSASLAYAPGPSNFREVSQSVFLGESAGESQTAGINPVTGDTIESENVGIGYQALQNTTTGTNNIAIGSNVLSGSVNGFNNIAISKGALGDFTGNNTAIGIGFDSGKPYVDNAFTGGHTGSTIVGHQALNDFNIKSTAEISNNTAIGLRALRGLGGTGTSNVNNVKNNTAIGRQAGLNIVHTTGGALNHNTFLGNSAGMNAVPQQGNMLSNLLLGARAGMSGYIGSNNIVLQNATGDTALGNTNWGVSENISIGGNGALYSDNNIIISNASSSVLNTVGTSSINSETRAINQSGNVIIGGYSNSIANISNRTSKDNSIINSTDVIIGSSGPIIQDTGGSDNNFIASAKNTQVQGDRNILLGVEITTESNTAAVIGDKNTIINSSDFSITNTTQQNTIIGSTGIDTLNSNGKNLALNSTNIDFNTGESNVSILSTGTSYTGSRTTVSLQDTNSSVSGDRSVLIGAEDIIDEGADNIYIGGSGHHTDGSSILRNVFIGGEDITVGSEGDDNLFLIAKDSSISGSNNIVAGLNHTLGRHLKHSFIHGNRHNVQPDSTSQRNIIVGYEHTYTSVGSNSFIGGTKGSIQANNSFGFGKGLKLGYENMGAFGKFNDTNANSGASSLFTVGCGPSATFARNAMNVVSATVDGNNNKAIVYLDQLVDFDFADDSAAADAGIGVGGLYHTEGTVKIRLT